MLAEAALIDTLAAAAATDADLVVALDGAPGPWLPTGMRVVPQRGDGLAMRLAAAFDDVGGPAVAIGMDTPQVTPALLTQALSALDDADVSYGPSDDGGYWAIGLRRADPRVFDGVPMSADDTGARQLERLAELELSVAHLPRLRDVDMYDDAIAVAADAPATRFAAAMTALHREEPVA